MKPIDPFENINIKNYFIRKTVLSFDIILDDDVITLSFSQYPKVNQEWYGNYKSKNHGSRLIPIPNVRNGIEATPEEISEALLLTLKINKTYKVQNIQKNYIDLFVPGFIEHSLIIPNKDKINPKSERIIAYVLFADLRGFSNWSVSVEPELIEEVFEVISERVVQMLLDYNYDYWKLLGDGIMLVWEANDENNEEIAASKALYAAYELHKKYWIYKDEALTNLPDGFGIAVCGGYVTKYQSSTFFESVIIQDYIGPIVNFAARLQTLANPGQVLVNKRVRKAVQDDLFSFENITKLLSSKLTKLKGLLVSENEIYKINHKYFSSDWENFLKEK